MQPFLPSWSLLFTHLPLWQNRVHEEESVLPWFLVSKGLSWYYVNSEYISSMMPQTMMSNQVGGLGSHKDFMLHPDHPCQCYSCNPEPQHWLKKKQCIQHSKWRLCMEIFCANSKSLPGCLIPFALPTQNKPQAFNMNKSSSLLNL